MISQCPEWCNGVGNCPSCQERRLLGMPEAPRIPSPFLPPTGRRIRGGPSKAYAESRQGSEFVRSIIIGR